MVHVNVVTSAGPKSERMLERTTEDKFSNRMLKASPYGFPQAAEIHSLEKASPTVRRPLSPREEGQRRAEDTERKTQLRSEACNKVPFNEVKEFGQIKTNQEPKTGRAMPEPRQDHAGSQPWAKMATCHDHDHDHNDGDGSFVAF